MCLLVSTKTRSDQKIRGLWERDFLGLEEFDTFPIIFVQEEELRARKREALMQQSRREAQLSRLRFEEERLKVRDFWNNIYC